MFGFDKFDVRAWTEYGMTKHVAIPAENPKPTRRSGSCVISALTLSMAAVLPSISLASVPQSLSVEVSHSVRDFGSNMNVTRYNSLITTKSIYVKRETSTALETTAPYEFAQKGTLAMSDSVRSLAQRVLMARDAKKSESGEQWANRFLQRVYGE